MSTTSRTGRTNTPTPDVELPVGAEPVLPASVTTDRAQLSDPTATMHRIVALCRDLQPTALLVWQAHDDETVRTLAGQLYGLTSAVEALARVNA